MKFFIQIFSFISIVTLCGCDEVQPSMTINYKVTVEIETPEGIKTGSAVRQISNKAALLRFPDVGNPATIRGEAVVVDLGERGKVFFTLSDQSWKNGLYQAFPIKGASTPKGIEYFNTLKVGDTAEWKEFKPKFVMFKDISDPTSVALLRTEESWNDDLKRVASEDYFEDVFGVDVRLKKVNVQITDEPITKGIVDHYLLQDFWEKYRNWILNLSLRERGKFTYLFRFKKGENQ